MFEFAIFFLFLTLCSKKIVVFFPAYTNLIKAIGNREDMKATGIVYIYILYWEIIEIGVFLLFNVNDTIYMRK